MVRRMRIVDRREFKTVKLPLDCRLRVAGAGVFGSPGGSFTALDASAGASEDSSPGHTPGRRAGHGHVAAYFWRSLSRKRLLSAVTSQAFGQKQRSTHHQ